MGSREPSTFSDGPHGGRRRRWRLLLWAGLLPVLLAIPQSIESSITLAERATRLLRRKDVQSIEQLLAEYKNVSLTVIAIGAVAGFCLWQSRQVLLLLLRLFAWATGMGYSDQRTAALLFPFYRELIQVHLRMLDVPIRRLAQALEVSVLMAWFIAHTPSFIIRPELLKKLCGELMVPERWLRKGGSYGSDYTLARLEWYHARGLGKLTSKLTTPEEIVAADHRARVSALRVIEQQLRRDLAPSREGGRHG